MCVVHICATPIGAPQEEAVKIWKQQQHEKAMQRKASYYIGMCAVF